MKKKIISLSLAFCLIFTTAFAHSGRTDSNGGHKDNNNVSGLGYYHYHCGGNPPHLHFNGVCPYKTSYTPSIQTYNYAPSATPTSTTVTVSAPAPSPQPVATVSGPSKFEVIKTTYPIKINNQDISNFASGWPPFIYENITYIPMTSYLVNELNLKLDFNNETGLNLSNQQILSTVGEPSTNVSDLDYTDYFYIYSKADSLKDSLNQLRNSFTDNYSYYNFSYYDRNYYSLLKDNLSLVKLDASLVDSILKSEDLFVELCVKHNIATEKEVREIFNNAENYAFSLNLIAGNMEFNAAKLDYSFDFTNGVNLSRDGLYEILTPLSEIEQKAFSKFYE